MKYPHGILAAERAAGYKDGWNTALSLDREEATEIALIRMSDRNRADNRWWFRFGIACGVAASVLIGAFF